MGEKAVQILLFAAVAFFFGWQLWRVLGRTGTDQPPQVRPNLKTPPVPVLVPPQPVAPVRPVAVPVAESTPDDPLAAGIQAIMKADPSFSVESFLKGARQAFEIIVKAFAGGDTATLRPLLSDDVYDTFAAAILDRQARNETVETVLVRVDPPELVQAHLDGADAFIEVRIGSSRTSVTRTAGGEIIDGDPDQPHWQSDRWTFARRTDAPGPNWTLVLIGEPE